jgi:glycerol uptake facilitator-like aquaporin
MARRAFQRDSAVHSVGYTREDVSGVHFDPAVTLAFALRGALTLETCCSKRVSRGGEWRESS